MNQFTNVRRHSMRKLLFTSVCCLKLLVIVGLSNICFEVVHVCTKFDCYQSLGTVVPSIIGMELVPRHYVHTFEKSSFNFILHRVICRVKIYVWLKM